MEKPQYNILSKTIQKIVSTRLGTLISYWIQRPIDTFLYKLTRGKLTYTGLGELPVVFVTTTGAKSGQPRTVPLVAVYDRQNPSVFALVASNWGRKNYPAWYYNLKACPVATCSIDGREQEYLTREAEGDEYQRFWEFAREVYIGYPKYKKRASHRRIPIMVMVPKLPDVA